MDADRFTSTAFGTVEREAGNRWSFWYFCPQPLPRELELSPITVAALSEADAALGLLQGLGMLIKQPEMLFAVYARREAVATSRIEGTQASLSDVLRAEAGATAANRHGDVDEVERYIAASRRGFERIDDLPLTQRLIREVHGVLMTGVRGEEKDPGHFRRTPVWIGSPTASPDTAAFVPPIAALIGELFADWERFVNEPSRLPVLIRCALMHYQFETIHPFLDGNGRIGRLLVGLMLAREERLTSPLLYLSGYLEQHRREYYERLQAVRERGEVQQWLQFFLTAVQRQAGDAVARASKLIELRDAYLADAAKARSQVGRLIDLILANPFVVVTTVERSLGCSNQTARNLVKEAERRGWLVSLGRVGNGGRMLWLARAVWMITSDEPGYGEEGR